MRSLLAAVCIMCGHSSAELGDDVNFTSYNIIGPIHGERDAYSGRLVQLSAAQRPVPAPLNIASVLVDPVTPHGGRDAVSRGDH